MRGAVRTAVLVRPLPLRLQPRLWYSSRDASTLFKTDSVTLAAEGDNAPRVRDKSGNSRHSLSQGSAGAVVTTATGLRRLRFDDAAPNGINIPLSVIATNVDVFALIQPISNGGTWILAHGDSSHYLFGADTGATPPYANSGSPTIKVNGVACATLTAFKAAAPDGTMCVVEANGADLSAWVAFFVGVYGSGYSFDGDIVELTFFPAMSEENRTLERNRLMALRV